SGCTGYRSQSWLTAHFGLGAATVADRIRVHWPSGIWQDTVAVAADHRIRMVEHATPVATPAPARASSRALAASPNPFAGTTRLDLALAAPGPVRLEVLDLGGRRVRSLESGHVLPAGPHEWTWDGRDAAGRPVPAGVYLVHLDGPDGPSLRR